MDRQVMRRELLAGALAAAQVPIAAAALARPRFWLDRRLNPHSERVVLERRRDLAWFRLDMLAQNALGRPLGRERWTRVVDAMCAEAAPTREPQRVAEASELDVEALLAAQRPVVVRGWLTRHAGLQPWDLDALIAELGEEPVTLTCPVRDGYPGVLRELDVPGVYLHNAEGLLRRHPELLERAGFPDIARTVAGRLMFSGLVQLFAGRGGTGSYWHCAGGMTLFLMLCGRKRWTYIDPAESPLLYPRTDGAGRSTYFYAESPRASVGVFEATAAHLTDQVAPDDSPHARALGRCQRHVVDLEPGDLLFSPAWWWHMVENRSDATIGMACRWAMRAPKVSNPLFDVGTRLNPSFFYRMARSFVSQRLVARDGTVDLGGWGDEVVAEAHTRGQVAADPLGLDPSVEAYYRQHGTRR